MMKSNNQLLIVSIVFFVMAIAFSLTVWADASWAAKIGLFAFGFGSGITIGALLAKRNS